MFKKTLFLVTILVFASFVMANDTVNLKSDVAPNINYKVEATDAQWDFQFQWNLQAQTTPDDQLLGGAFDGTYFWVTGGGGTSGGRPNSLYKFTSTGTLITFYTQSNTTSWGWRDLCWDGVYLYAGTDASGGNAPVAIIDPLAANPGQQIGQITIVGTGTNFARALCWDPVSDHFYCANFGSPAMEFTRQGVIIRQVTIAGITGAYGMAWDNDDPAGGTWIWIFDQSGTPQTTMRQINPVTLTATGVTHVVPNFAGNTAGIAGGCEYTDEYNTQFSTIVCLVQGTPNDAMCGLEMYPIGPVIPHNITIDMTPINPPIQIPAIGGSFQYTVTLLNADTLTVNFNAWIKAQLPNGSYYLCAGPVTLNFVVGQTLSRTRTQNVPGGAPSGDYLYIGYVGLYPNNIWNQDSFPFTKLAGDGSGGNWYNWGESFDGSGEITGLNPTKCEIIGSYPNPFNPRTNIRYNLPEAGNVKLVVYDVTGREVVTLMNGWLDAGIHESVFYADNLPSGIYFYSLTAGDYTVTEKMVLTK